jgi:hypothetical protein
LRVFIKKKYDSGNFQSAKIAFLQRGFQSVKVNIKQEKKVKKRGNARVK